jgi:hypothetical protein
MPIQIHYRVDFYEGSISAGKVVFSLEPAATPFAFAPGEFVDPGGPEAQHNIAISLKAVAR